MLFRYIRVLSEVENQMKYASQKRVLFEVALIKLCKPEMERDLESVINRLHNLEDQLSQGVMVQNSEKDPAMPQPDRVSEVPEKKKMMESAVSQEVKVLAGNWGQVLNQLDSVSRTMLNHVTLTVNDQGSLVVAFAEETSYSYFAGNPEHTEMLTGAAAQVAGKLVDIQFKMTADQREYDALPELRGLFGDSDIEIETTK